MSFRHHASVTLVLVLAAAVLVAPVGAAEDIVVIVNLGNPHTVDRAYVAGIYTGRTKGWPDGSPVFSLDLGEAEPERQTFYQTVVGKSLAHMSALWAQNIFAGRGLPPKLATPGAEMKRIVAANRHAIGYIKASELDDTVKVLWR